MATLSDYAAATRTRDVISKLVADQVNRERPSYRYATVQQIDRITRQCIVTYPGETGEVSGVVSMGAVQPFEVGQIVRVDGRVGDRYISDVMGRIHITGELVQEPVQLTAQFTDLDASYLSKTLFAPEIWPTDSYSQVNIPSDSLGPIPIGATFTFINMSKSKLVIYPLPQVTFIGNGPHMGGAWGTGPSPVRLARGKVTATKIATDQWLLEGDIERPSVHVWGINQVIATNSWTVLQYNITGRDQYSLHDPFVNPSRFNIPSVWLPGMYTLTTRVRMGVAGSGGDRGIKVSTTAGFEETLMMIQPTTFFADTVLNGSITLSLSPGDAVEILGFQTSGANMNIHIATTEMYFEQLDFEAF